MTKYHLIPEETALIVIDMQNSWCHPEGSIGRNGYNASMMRGIVPNVRNLIEACREAGIMDVWTIQNHYLDDITKTKHRIKPHTHRWEAGPPGIRGTWEAEVVDELKDLAEDEQAELVTKHRFSGFFDTRMNTLLRMKGINTVIVCGVSTTHCVETTVRDAYQHDYDVIIAKDAVAGLSIEEHNASLHFMNKVFGVALEDERLFNLIKGESISLELTTEIVVTDSN